MLAGFSEPLSLSLILPIAGVGIFCTQIYPADPLLAGG